MDIIEELLKNNNNKIYDITIYTNIFIRVRNKEDWIKVLSYLYNKVDIYFRKDYRITTYDYNIYKEESCISLTIRRDFSESIFSSYSYYKAREYYYNIPMIEVNQLKDWND